MQIDHCGRTREIHALRALAVAIAPVSVPFVLGLMIGHWSAPALAPAINPSVYSLFVGVGRAITAVPILGRILRQYGLTRTRIGVIAITSAAVNDVVGWILFAGVTAIAAARFSIARTSSESSRSSAGLRPYSARCFRCIGPAGSGGFSPAESWALGALMNTRVLMELIVVNVGFDLGFLPQRAFTMLLPRIDHSCPQDADA